MAARAANTSGRPLHGARIVRRALRALDRSPRLQQVPLPTRAHARARLLITLAFSQFEIHGLEHGRRALGEAMEAAGECDDLDVVALLHDLQGLMLVRGGDLEGSLLEFDAAIDLLQHLDPVDRPSLFLNRGSVQLFRRNIAAARHDFGRCVEISTAIGLTRIEFKARHNLGYAEFLAGDLPLALESMARADALDVPVSRSVGLLDRARVLMEAGLLEEADLSLAEAGELLTREHASQDLAETMLARAECALLRGEWKLARDQASRARRSFGRRGSTGWQARADMTRWQAQLTVASAVARVAREIDSMTAEPPDGVTPDARVLLIAAEAHLALGHVAEAGTFLDRMAPARSDDSLTARLHQHLVSAGVARAAGDRARARRELRTGLTALAEQQARHHSLDLRTAMAVHGGRLAELDLRIAVESQSAGTVFDSLERWRAMSHRRTAVTPPSDPELADLLSQLRIVSEDIRNAPPGASLERKRRNQQGLERSIREREWRLQSEGRTERSVRLRDLRPTLVQRDADVISYYVLDRTLGAVTVTRGRAKVHSLAPWADVGSVLARVRADLDALAGRLLSQPLRVAVSASLRRDLERLERLLLPDTLTDSGSLVVVPTRTLPTAPWGLLPGRRGRPTTVSVSATGWLRGARDKAHGAPRVLAMAGPGLPLAGREVRDVGDRWPGSSAVGSPDSDARTLAQALTTHDVVHIAAHGTHNQDNPLFSSIRLTGGPLYAYDIPHDAPIAGHIVLSACELGMTSTRPGGDVLGLTAAFLSMGARSVVSSISRVDDTTAYETMRRYHDLLASGVDSATALAQTHDVGDADLGHPAPFVCFGSTWAARAPSDTGRVAP